MKREKRVYIAMKGIVGSVLTRVVILPEKEVAIHSSEFTLRLSHSVPVASRWGNRGR